MEHTKSEGRQKMGRWLSLPCGFRPLPSLSGHEIANEFLFKNTLRWRNCGKRHGIPIPISTENANGSGRNWSPNDGKFSKFVPIWPRDIPAMFFLPFRWKRSSPGGWPAVRVPCAVPSTIAGRPDFEQRPVECSAVPNPPVLGLQTKSATTTTRKLEKCPVCVPCSARV